MNSLHSLRFFTAIAVSVFSGTSGFAGSNSPAVVNVSPAASIVGGTPFSLDANTIALGGGTYELHAGGRSTLRPHSLKFGSGYIDLNEHLMVVPANATVSYQSSSAMLLSTGAYVSPGLAIGGTLTISSGITKSGAGTLILSGGNTYNLGTSYLGAGTGSFGGLYGSGTTNVVIDVGGPPPRTWAPPVPPPPIPGTFPSNALSLIRSNLRREGSEIGSITSSLLELYPDRVGIGHAVAEDLELPGKYARRDIATGDLIVRAALLGDADLDGNVDKYDIRRLSQQFNSTDRRWSWGDFDHDGRVNLTDFAMLTRNYGVSLDDVIAPPTDLPRIRGALTPEPSGVLLFGATGGVLLRRRNRPTSAELS